MKKQLNEFPISDINKLFTSSYGSQKLGRDKSSQKLGSSEGEDF